MDLVVVVGEEEEEVDLIEVERLVVEDQLLVSSRSRWERSRRDCTWRSFMSRKKERLLTL